MTGYFAKIRNRFGAKPKPAAAADGGQRQNQARAAGETDEVGPGKLPLRPVIILGGLAAIWIGLICAGGMLAWFALPEISPMAAMARFEPRGADWSPVAGDYAAVGESDRSADPTGPAQLGPEQAMAVRLLPGDTPGPDDPALATAAPGRIGAAEATWNDPPPAPAMPAALVVGPPSPGPGAADQSADPPVEPERTIFRYSVPVIAPAVPGATPGEPAGDSRPRSSTEGPSARAPASANLRASAADPRGGRRATRDRRYQRAYAPRAPWGRYAMVRECDRPAAQFDAERSGHNGEFCR